MELNTVLLIGALGTIGSLAVFLIWDYWLWYTGRTTVSKWVRANVKPGLITHLIVGLAGFIAGGIILGLASHFHWS